jgi:hypothetical protein
VDSATVDNTSDNGNAPTTVLSYEIPVYREAGWWDRERVLMQKYIDAQTEKLGDRWKPDIM